MARQINLHVFDRKARAVANVIGVASGVILVFGLVIGACIGCQEIIINTGRAIIHP